MYLTPTYDAACSFVSSGTLCTVSGMFWSVETGFGSHPDHKRSRPPTSTVLDVLSTLSARAGYRSVRVSWHARTSGRRSRGVCETYNLPATDDRVVNPTKQAVRQGSPKNDCVNFLTNVRLHVILPAFLFSIVVCFFHHVRKFDEPGTEGDRSNRGVSVYKSPL